MDNLDRNILKAFQLDARVKNADLARQLGVAPSTMLERVRRLEERGYFSGFKAVINPEKLGLHVTGRFDYILHVVAKNLKQLGSLVKERIASMPGVGKTETFLVFSEIKNENGFPLDEAGEDTNHEP